MTFSFSAPDTVGGWAYRLAWGDGSSDSGATAAGAVERLRHAFANAGEFDAVVTVLRADGARGADTIHVSIAPEPAPEIFAGAGDIASCSSDGDEATATLLDAIPGTIFALGDNVYPRGSIDDYTHCYDPSWGRHKARTRPAVGNHEYETRDAAGYFAYFGAAAGDPGEGWYSYELGAWHIVVLNSNFREIDARAQESWLRADLAAHPARCTLAYAHHPRFSSGIPGGGESGMTPLWQILYDAGVDVVLAGHDHGYERFRPQKPSGSADGERGIVEFVVGTGGASSWGIRQPIAGSVTGFRGYGVLKLELGRRDYAWEYLPIPGSKSYSDAGRMDCH